MNIREIQDRLIGAESIIREVSSARAGPAPLRAQQLPYVHSEDDMRNWGHRRGERRSTDPKATACRLRPEDEEAHSIYRREFWDEDDGPQPAEISGAYQTLDLIMLVDDDGERRALRAWAYAMAGGRPFSHWCKRVEGISVMTGRRRKTRAVQKILTLIPGDTHLHDENGLEAVLPVTPENGHIPDTLAPIVSGSETGLTSWASDEAFQPFRILEEVHESGLKKRTIPTDQAQFSWAAKRNEMRRKREERRRKEQDKRAA